MKLSKLTAFISRVFSDLDKPSSKHIAAMYFQFSFFRRFCDIDRIFVEKHQKLLSPHGLLFADATEENSGWNFCWQFFCLQAPSWLFPPKHYANSETFTTKKVLLQFYYIWAPPESPINCMNEVQLIPTASDGMSKVVANFPTANSFLEKVFSEVTFRILKTDVFQLS